KWMMILPHSLLTMVLVCARLGSLGMMLLGPSSRPSLGVPDTRSEHQWLLQAPKG
ncbi:hypothetical protein XENORESO_004142, partial [Xenotaenia resolanae]